MRKINRIVIHCSAGSATQRASAIIAWHTLPVARGGRGWHAPGYHYIIEADGNIVASWPIDRIANGARGFNADSIHICYTGGLDACGHPADTRTPAQKAALRRLIADLRQRFGPLPVAGHRDLSPDRNGNGRLEPSEWLKPCPCFDARNEYVL